MACTPALATGIFVDSAEYPLLLTARPGAFHRSNKLVIINDPVPMTITRVAGVERAQLLLESSSRAVLQAFLKPWMQALRESKSRLRWSLEVDPVDI